MPEQQLITIESKNGLYVAHFIDSRMPYSAGKIKPPQEYDNDASRAELLQVIVDSIKPVLPQEKPYTGCTDGRIPIKLESEEPVPLREKLVGADILTALFIADSLGRRFYADPDAPVEARLREVAEFLENPSTHVPCGAGDGFPVVSANVAKFAAHPEFIERNRLFVPDGVFDQGLFESVVVEGAKRRAALGAYEDYDPGMVAKAVRGITGPRGIAYLREDGRGVHGHVEEFIVDIQIPNVAGDEAAVAAATGDREAFWQNDPRLEDLARKLSRNDEDFAIAMMAGRAWTDSGHATLSDNLRTAVVTAR